MPKSLYQQQTANWEKIAERHPEIAEMAKHFTTVAAMNRALGIQGVHHWHNGVSGTSNASNRIAELWLQNHEESQNGSIPSTNLVPAPELTTSDTKTFLMVIPPAAEAKVLKILAMLDCEVAEL